MIEEQSVAAPTFPSSPAPSSEAIAVEVLSDGKLAKSDHDQPVITSRGALFPQQLLNVGFCVALVLAGTCFITAALYLNEFLSGTNQGVEDLIAKATSVGSTLSSGTLEVAINARLVIARIALLSCGVFIGMSFGFLGFALFLMGLKDEMNVSGRYESYYIKLGRLSPGVFVILCATVLIGICATRSTPFSYDHEVVPARVNNAAKKPDVPEFPGRSQPIP